MWATNDIDSTFIDPYIRIRWMYVCPNDKAQQGQKPNWNRRQASVGKSSGAVIKLFQQN